MNREQMQQLIRQASGRGDDVTINISAHVALLLRGLADDIESGKQQVGLAEMRLVQEHRPYATYVISVKDA
ncbi:hypothetical protein [Pseudomonas protegens]|uniref:hypothetical protein n=1 Tax=Pseudomonas protegens TaxID=380021 RepID=UPI00274DDFB4|nr:hypothetical protein [Pseudomonas protegens]MDP9528505.1 hypothetical protein [Pseudomonas protegens]